MKVCRSVLLSMVTWLLSFLSLSRARFQLCVANHNKRVKSFSLSLW